MDFKGKNALVTGAASGIGRATAITPGSVSGSSDRNIDGVVHEGFSAYATYIGRSGSHRENASLICFLASDAASYISGENVQIDGCRKQI